MINLHAKGLEAAAATYKRQHRDTCYPDALDGEALIAAEAIVRAYLSNAEPAAPVPAGDGEAVAYRIHAPDDDHYGRGPDSLQFHPLAQHDLDAGYTQTPLFDHRLAALRSASPESRPSGHVEIAHDGFAGDIIGHYITREGKRGVVVQQDGTRVVHVYGEKWLTPSLNQSEKEISHDRALAQEDKSDG